MFPALPAIRNKPQHVGGYPHVPHYVGAERSDPPPSDPREMVHKVQIQVSPKMARVT